jgi:ferredoxin
LKYLPERCDGCGICAAVCPFAAVIVNGNDVIFLDGCTRCDLCAQACPGGAILQDEERYEDRWERPASLAGTG